MSRQGDAQPGAVDIETKGAVLTKARFTFNPSQVFEVGDAELLDAKRGGFLHSYDHGNTPLEKGLAPWHDGEVTEVEPGVITDAAPSGADEKADDKAAKTTKKGDS